MNKMVIHISGASGSGKTTLGKKIKERFGRKVVIEDLDDLRDNFIKNFYGDRKWRFINEKAYQKHIDEFVFEHKKPIIFVGLKPLTNITLMLKTW